MCGRQVNAEVLREAADRLGRLVDRTSGARGQAHRFRWQDAESAAEAAETAAAKACGGGSGQPGSLDDAAGALMEV